jgi:hypothetical protein
VKEKTVTRLKQLAIPRAGRMERDKKVLREEDDGGS